MDDPNLISIDMPGTQKRTLFTAEKDFQPSQHGDYLVRELLSIYVGYGGKQIFTMLDYQGTQTNEQHSYIKVSHVPDEIYDQLPGNEVRYGKEGGGYWRFKTYRGVAFEPETDFVAPEKPNPSFITV